MRNIWICKTDPEVGLGLISSSKLCADSEPEEGQGNSHAISQQPGLCRFFAQILLACHPPQWRELRYKIKSKWVCVYRKPYLNLNIPDKLCLSPLPLPGIYSVYIQAFNWFIFNYKCMWGLNLLTPAMSLTSPIKSSAMVWQQEFATHAEGENSKCHGKKMWLRNDYKDFRWLKNTLKRN